MSKLQNVTQKDLDLIRVEAEAIESTDDKYYLMEKLHECIEVIETQIEESENSKKSNFNRAKLEKLQEYAQEVRSFIMNRPVGRKRYGLFVEYPEGYDG